MPIFFVPPWIQPSRRAAAQAVADLRCVIQLSAERGLDASGELPGETRKVLAASAAGTFRMKLLGQLQTPTLKRRKPETSTPASSATLATVFLLSLANGCSSRTFSLK